MKLLILIFVIILIHLSVYAPIIQADTTEPVNQASEPDDNMSEAIKEMNDLTERFRSEKQKIERERLEYNRVQNARLRRERLEQDENDKIENERLQNEPAKREMKKIKRIKIKKKPVKEKTNDDEIAIKSTTFERYMAMGMAEKFVSQKLKAPSTAKFSSKYDMAAERNSKNIWSVTGYVDSQNSYGAMLRSNFYVKMKQDGDRWFPIKIQVQ